MSAQNIISLGIDTSTFNAERKAILNEYIELFDRLIKYDGKKISPVLGEGITAFNASLKETNQILSEINAKMSNLTTLTNANTSSRENALSKTKSLTQAEKDYRQEQERVVEALRQLAKEQDKDNADKRIAQKQQEKEASKRLAEQKKLEAQETKNLENIKKKEIEDSKLAEKQKLQEEKANQALLNSYLQLKNSVKQKEEAYANAVLGTGKNSVQSKAALIDYRDASRQLNDIERNIESAGGRAKLFGGALSTAFGHLRNIAYILPGLGIAGIFNLAFEAIGNAAKELGIFNDEQLESIKNQIEYNEQFKKFEDVLNSVNSTLSDWGTESTDALKTNLEQLKALGKSTDDILKAEIQLAKLRFENAEDKFKDTGGTEKLQQLRLEVIGEEQRYIGLKKANDEYIRGNQNGVGKLDPIYLEEAKSSLDRAEYNYNKQKKIVEEYNASLSDLSYKSIAINTFEAEQIRKARLETAKISSESVKNANSIILSDERSTLEERLAAIEKIKEATQSLANAQIEYTKDRPDYKNADGTLTAESKASIENSQLQILEAARKASEASEKQRIEFYQRKIKAKSEIDKSEIDDDAIKNEKIFKNENKSMEVRLEAYLKYIEFKKKMQDIENERDLQKGASGPGGKTSLTKEESAAINANTNTQKANIVADQENQIYNIVYSSLRKKLTAIIDEQKSEEDLSKESYINALEALNKKNLSAERYQQERKKIDNKYQKEQLDAAIAYDEINLDQLKRFQARETKALLDQAKRKLEIAKASGDINRIEKAQGEVNAAERANTDAEKDIKVADDKLQSDRLKRAKLGPEIDDGQKKRLQAAVKISLTILDSLKKIIDDEYDYKKQQVERWKDLVDEQFGYQKDAVEKSSIPLKDKQALEIQLQQKKLEADKQADRDLRKIAHDKAVFDRDISIAKIIASTIEAAAIAGFITPAAIAIEAVGAAEIATLLAVRIPSYKDGTTNHKGGLARYGEDGAEIVKEPYKSPYLVFSETISYLPKGTQVIPIKDSPIFEGGKDSSWEQTRYLAKQIMKNKQEIKNIFKPNVKIDINFELYKNSILRN